MSTIAHCLRQRLIQPYDLPEWETRTARRDLYVAPSFWDWVDGRDDLHEIRAHYGRRSIFEHVEIMLSDFCCSVRPLGGSALKRMRPTRDGVWKIHAASARLFGWVPEPNTYVVVSGETKDRLTEDRTLYNENLEKVVAFRRGLSLTIPHVTGDYRDVFTP